MVNLDLDRAYFKKSIKVLSISAIESIIESKRITLNEFVQSTGDFTHPVVIRLSQEIDEYIIELQKVKLQKSKSL